MIRPYLHERLTDIPSPYLLAAQERLGADADDDDVAELAVSMWSDAKEAAREMYEEPS